MDNKKMIVDINDVLDKSEVISRDEFGYEGTLDMIRNFLKIMLTDLEQEEKNDD